MDGVRLNGGEGSNTFVEYEWSFGRYLYNLIYKTFCEIQSFMWGELVDHWDAGACMVSVKWKIGTKELGSNFQHQHEASNIKLPVLRPSRRGKFNLNKE